MTPAQSVALLIPAGYLIGSIPFGLLVGKSRGIDPRKGGSGNIGATNVGRLLGLRFFLLVFLLDMLKGLLPMLAAGGLLHFAANDWPAYLAWLGVGVATILGHMFSVFLRFKGGKGVATSFGVVLGLFPYLTLPSIVALATFGVVFQITRYVSLGSIIGALMVPTAYVVIGLWRVWPVFGAQWPVLLFSVLIAAMIVYKHRGNIARLRQGSESRFEKR